MRSWARLRLFVMLALVAAAVPCVATAQPDAPQGGAVPARADVRRALDEVAADPNLTTERSVTMLRWKRDEPNTDDEPWWLPLARWLRGLFAWFAESGRLVVWVVGALLAGLLGVYLVRLVRARGLPRVPKAFVPPSHVRDLDIRPESLPADVGAAALALWQQGEQRGALALLYRGLLSRLVHAHGVPIRASSTEGECLVLARPRLGEGAARYAARLVETWAAAVYGGLLPATSTVESLCREFAGALGERAEAA